MSTRLDDRFVSWARRTLLACRHRGLTGELLHRSTQPRSVSHWRSVFKTGFHDGSDWMPESTHQADRSASYEPPQRPFIGSRVPFQPFHPRGDSCFALQSSPSSLCPQLFCLRCFPRLPRISTAARQSILPSSNHALRESLDDFRQLRLLLRQGIQCPERAQRFRPGLATVLFRPRSRLL